MCGIVAVVRRPSARSVPAARSLRETLSSALEIVSTLDLSLDVRLAQSAAVLEAGNTQMLGVPGVRGLLTDPSLVPELHVLCLQLGAVVTSIEVDLDGSDHVDELLNASLIRMKDAVWAIQRDRLRTALAVGDFLDEPVSAVTDGMLGGYLSIQTALSAIDRLEVRGRDSAGLHVLVYNHGLDLSTTAVTMMIGKRNGDALFTNSSVRTPNGCLSFVYKASAEIGELGDNTAALRATIAADDLLRLALRDNNSQATIVAHTRWASVGIISQANTHPLNSEETGEIDDLNYVAAALNGDVDNHADLKAAEHLKIAAEITTDAKVIPALVSRRLGAGMDPVEAFRTTVGSFEGSVAIAANAVVVPGQVMLALRGSGQGVYVGLADDAYLVVSEPYGLVEETPTYLRLDGETPSDPDRPAATRGQVLVLDAKTAGTKLGVRRLSYDGTELPVADSEWQTAQVTTRDINRGLFPHFLLKEITESPESFRKTLRGRVHERDNGDLVADVGLPDRIVARLRSGEITKVLVIGQGTAAVAGQSLAATLDRLVAGTAMTVSAMPATELSGFHLESDMSEVLAVAISQSGTTTDTNRTVDIIRERGASVVAIVNRRGSDLTDKADAVVYTSDGRDIEMSVASTKAFYAQVAAGVLVACDIAENVVPAHSAERTELIAALRHIPAAMTRTLALRPEIAIAAQRHAPSRRYWAVVGNGPNKVAANEVRIKASELCYKSIPADFTEDKKHLDLSCEPLILVCAAGLVGSTADDVSKEVAIFRAHKAAPIVIANEGEDRFKAALEVIHVPEVHPALGFILSAMAGHLFSYEAALAIDHQALTLRQARAAIERASTTHVPESELLAWLSVQIAATSREFSDGVRSGAYNGHLEAGTAVRLASLLRYGTGQASLDSYQIDEGKVGTPAVVVEDLTMALTRAIEELTRPVDAIKHQAKTVTVGISRSDESLFGVPLVASLLRSGAPRDRLAYRTLRTIAGLDPAVIDVLGSTRYEVVGDLADGATVRVVDRSGIAMDLVSRTDRDPALRGTKHRAAVEREVTVSRGRHDGRTIIIVPEVKGNETTGLTLLHVRFHDRMAAGSARSVLEAYRTRFDALRDAVTETEPTFRDDVLGSVGIVELLTEPVVVLADRWRSS